MGAGTAAYKGIIAAKKAFAPWKSKFCAGNLSSIGTDHVNVKKTAKG